jgi:hypothetical protein
MKQLVMSSNSNPRSPLIAGSSKQPPHPSAHSISRQEVIYFIQLYITTTLLQHFLREEMHLAEQSRRQTLPNSDNDSTYYDEAEINKIVNRKIKLYRSFIKRQSHFFDNILYKRSTALEEYYNLEDLEERLNEVGRILNAHLTRMRES